MKIRQAAAVIVSRETADGAEVYLVERAPELRFFGGYWAFPGGVLEAEDRAAGDGMEAFACAALRELQEETGVRGERGDLEEVCRLTTPAFVPVRYETQFFHLPLPAGSEPQFAPGELVDGGFFRAAELRAQWRAGHRLVVPPALMLLELLEGEGLAGLAAAATEVTTALENGRLHPVRFSPGIFVAPLRTPTLPPATTTNCLLVGEKRVHIVDPATYEESEQARLFETLDRWRGEGRHLEGVLLTHHHHDHIGAVAAVAERYDLPVRAHPRTLERLDFPVARPEELHDGDRIELGTAPDGSENWTLQALHTPGHDQGHLVFLESRYRALVAGDLVSTVSTIVIDPPEGHLATYLASLERVRRLGVGMLYPAHGPAHRDGPGILSHYLEHRQMREDRLLEALTPGARTVDQLLPQVYADVAEELYPLAGRSLQAGLDKLAEEQRAEHHQGRWSLTTTPAS